MPLPVSAETFGTDRLCIVFNDIQISAFGDGHDGFHIRTLTKEMYRDDGFSPWRK